MVRRFRADLHIHTCLSPCADLEMTPKNIVARAREQRLAMIAVCDHNSAENAPAVCRAAEGQNLVVLAGMEVCTREEAHVLALFEDCNAALTLQSLVYSTLTGLNDPEVFGLQVIANERDEVVAMEPRLLIGATGLPVDELVNEIHRLGGLAIASHIDRESFSVIGQLGFLPKDLGFDALELSRNIDEAGARTRFKDYEGSTFVRNSDAHRLTDIGHNVTDYRMEEPAFRELRRALRNEDRRIVCRS